MPKYDRPASSLSIRTINNMRSELYQMQQRVATAPNHPDRDVWEARIAHLRLRLGEEVVPLTKRSTSGTQHHLHPQSVAQQEAQRVLEEMEEHQQRQQREQTEGDPSAETN